MLRVNVPLDPSKTGREAEVLESNLRKLIIGQDEAIQQIVNIYQMHLTGMSAPGRPIGNFLFLGPTGSGKTRIVEATAESLVKNARAVIKIDCALASCSACASRSAAIQDGFAVSSAMTSTSDGPAIMSMPTLPNTCRFAAAT